MCLSPHTSTLGVPRTYLLVLYYMEISKCQQDLRKNLTHTKHKHGLQENFFPKDALCVGEGSQHLKTDRLCFVCVWKGGSGWGHGGDTRVRSHLAMNQRPGSSGLFQGRSAKPFWGLVPCSQGQVMSLPHLNATLVSRLETHLAVWDLMICFYLCPPFFFLSLYTLLSAPAIPCHCLLWVISSS